MQLPFKKLLDQVRDVIRLKHYAYPMEQTYGQWIRCYVLVDSKSCGALGAVINYDYASLLARVSAPSLMCWNGRGTVDTRGLGA